MQDGKEGSPMKASSRDGRKNRERASMVPVQCAGYAENINAREK